MSSMKLWPLLVTILVVYRVEFMWHHMYGYFIFYFFSIDDLVARDGTVGEVILLNVRLSLVKLCFS